MRKLLCLFLAICVPIHPAAARNAGISMPFERVILDRDHTVSMIDIKNPGDETGDYTLDLLDMRMLENGAIAPYPRSQTAQYSALPYLRLSPRRMTLKPGEARHLSLRLNLPAKIQPGEYRAHLKVRAVGRDTEPRSATEQNPATISAKANFVFIIPVIVRTGVPVLAVHIDSPQLLNDQGIPRLDLYLTRHGNRSAFGDIFVFWDSPAGKRELVKVFPNAAIYRPLVRRSISVPLNETPGDVDLSQGKLRIVYALPRSEGGKHLAAAALALQGQLGDANASR